MCGIFGLSLNKIEVGPKRLEQTLVNLVKNSQERGRDSLGLYFQTGKFKELVKYRGASSDFVVDAEFQRIIKAIYDDQSSQLLVLGLTRLTMSGSSVDLESIQPILVDGTVGIHNGIFTRLEEKKIQTQCDLSNESDSKHFFQFLSLAQKKSNDPFKTMQQTLSKVEGSYSLAAFFGNIHKLILASNTGSLYYSQTKTEALVLASELNFVVQAITDLGWEKDASRPDQVRGVLEFDLNLKENIDVPKRFPSFEVLKRCTRCILPHTYPFISFDKNGVCNFCLAYEKQKIHGETELLRELDKYRSKDGSPDCLVGLSGGRDSSYGIWALKKKFGMTPIAYTFDWGLTTDSSRRNQAIVTGKLGIEHIIRAPDIGQRRRHIQKNIDAFLKSPHLGMVPLFMAGDKDFYHYGRKLRKELNVALSIHCTGHEVERLHFKTGFCGVDDRDQHNVRMYDFSNLNKLKLALFYSGQYLKNPAYINESFFYSLRSFIYSFLQKDDFLYLYRYIQWDEAQIEKTLSEELGWEPDPKYGKNQWRMGDGQTAFTNYIYHTVAGFSEFDNFRANQVRAGLLDRDEALKLASIDNIPKWEVLKEFSMTVGFCLEDVVKKINQIPKI